MSDAPPRLTIRLLGAPEVQSGGLPLALNSQKAWAKDFVRGLMTTLVAE